MIYEVELTPKNIGVNLTFDDGVVYPEKDLSEKIISVAVEYNGIRKLYSIGDITPYSHSKTEYYKSCELLVWGEYSISILEEDKIKIFFIFKSITDYAEYKLRHGI